MGAPILIAALLSGPVVEAVAELLTSGGHQDDVDGLLYAAMAHQRRRRFRARSNA